AIPWHAHGSRVKLSRRETRSARRSSTGGRCRRLRRGGGWRGLKGGIEPAGMHAAIQAVLGLGIDMALAHDTTKSGLDMRARAAKTVVEVEVTEGGVEVVPP